MDAKAFNLSEQGASHIKRNKECQDTSTSYCDGTIAIVVVCDGHGGNDYVRSAIGSKCACEAAEENIKAFIKTVNKDELRKNTEEIIKNLEASIINDWNNKITAHAADNPFTEEELKDGVSEKAKKKYLYEHRIESAYGTTMIAAAVTPDYWFGIHIGDGKCVAVNPKGNFVQPIPWDNKCFLNATTSMCDSRALENFRYFYSEKLPVAVFVGSDGIDDCFQNDEQLYNLYKTVLYSFTTSDYDEAIDGLTDYLPRLSAKGSGDDVSLAVVLDMDTIGNIDAVKSFDVEKEKARKEEKARLEAKKAEEEKRRAEEETARAAAERNRLHKKTYRNVRYCKICGAPISGNNKCCANCSIKISASETGVTDKNKVDEKQVEIPVVSAETNAIDEVKATDVVEDTTEIKAKENEAETKAEKTKSEYKWKLKRRKSRKLNS